MSSAAIHPASEMKVFKRHESRYAGTACGANNRSRNSLRTSQRLNIACSVTLATEIYQSLNQFEVRLGGQPQ